MSDPSTPPKPKPGSLRDRIAAFEKSASAPQPAAPAPALRPKPAGFASWKPKQPSPPSSPAAERDVAAAATAKAGGMSATDAKESIGKGGSLKERMAALQGKGAFGAPAPPPIAPKPTVERPKWKPPPAPVVVPEEKEEKEEHREREVTSPPPSVKSPKPESIKSVEMAEEKPSEPEPAAEGEEGEADPEEEERQRRAAIAARMARLGGARLGMAPPVFGKPAVKKPEPHKEEKEKVENKDEPAESKDEDATVKADDAPKEHIKYDESITETITEGNVVTSPPQITSPEPELVSEDKTTDLSASTSVDSEGHARSQASMPIPAVPRRAGPPRRKTPKSPAAPPSETAAKLEAEAFGEAPVPPVTEEADKAVPAEHAEDKTEEAKSIEEKHAEAEHEPEQEHAFEAAAPVEIPEAAAHPEKDVREAEEEEAQHVSAAAHAVEEEKEHLAAPVPEPEAQSPIPVKAEEEEEEVTEHVEAVVAVVAQETEGDEEEARKKRLAEKLAKMGGVNPLAPPPARAPQRQSSTSSESHAPPPVSAPEPKRRDSVRKSSIDSSISDSIYEPAVEEQEEAPAQVSEETIVKAVQETVAEVAEEEEEEEARKKRIAERLAKMGGVNPFAVPQPRPQRKPSAEEDRPVPTKRDSVGSVSSQRKASAEGDRPVPVKRGSVGSVSAPQRKSSIAEEDVSHRSHPPKRDSVGSIKAPTKRDSVGSIEVPQRRESVRRSSVDSTHKDTAGDKPEIAAKSPEIPAAAASPEIIKEEEGEDDGNYSVAVSELDKERYESDNEEEEEAVYGQHPVAVKTAGISHDEAEDLVEEVDDEGDVAPSSPPPPPVRPTRTLSMDQPYSPASVRTAERALSPPAVSLPPRRGVPPPPPPQEDEEDELDDEMDESASERLAASTLFVPPPRARGQSVDDDYESDGYDRRHRNFDEESTDNESSVAIPIPHRASMAFAAQALASADSDAEYPPSGTVTGRPKRAIPNIPRPPSSDIGDSDFGGEMLPTRPRVSPGTPSYDSMSLSMASEELDERTPVVRSPPVGRSFPPPPPPLPVESPVDPEVEQEVLDEEEGDPIDPNFHSPSGQASSANLRSTAQGQSNTAPSPVSPPPVEEEEEETEQARRRTIAERMAKLGGIRFGAPPIPASISRRPPPSAEETAEEEATEQSELTEEEEERARKARIAVKLAGMGGMRIGMIPGMAPAPRAKAPEQTMSTSPPQRAVPPARPPPPPQAEEDEVSAKSQRGPPSRPPPPPQDDSEASDDGVKVEAEESELEEVSYEEVEPIREEAPPPVPTRMGRRSSATASIRRDSQEARSPPTSPRPASGRPPIPTGLPPRKSSTGTVRSPTRSGSMDSYSQRQMLVHKPHSEYVIVDEPDIIESEEREETPPPPPARPGHRPPPPRAVPSAPRPPAVASDSISSQWELPSIPTSSLEFSGGSSDLSMSWTEAGDSYTQGHGPSSPPPPPPPAKEPAPHHHHQTERNWTPDELMEIWGRIGVQVCESATQLFEKSKRTLVGDGSYRGFLAAVLNEVANAAPLSHGYGYLIYAQTGSAVQKRISDILPGDVVEVSDAKFKGHKGIQMYNLHVGAEEPLVGVVEEFEARKSKVRVFKANQHVGQQSVESSSYKLEDLKSGSVKVYRVLPAN